MLDVMMPQVDGWELLAAIKSNPATRDIPVIVCSVLKSPALALKLGAAAYLPKPVSQQALIEALARWSQASYTAATGS
jgi:CheY-like chemotaxis protein